MFDDRAADRQPHAEALGLGGEERGEHALQQIGGQSGAGVATRPRCRRRHCGPPRCAGFSDGLRRISWLQRHSEQDLAELAEVAHGLRGWAGAPCRDEFRVRRRRARAGQHENLLDDLARRPAAHGRVRPSMSMAADAGQAPRCRAAFAVAGMMRRAASRASSSSGGSRSSQRRRGIRVRHHSGEG